MKVLGFILMAILLFDSCSKPDRVNRTEDLLTPFELGDGNQSPTYEEGMRFWYELAQVSPYVALDEYGNTDAQENLHLAIWSADGTFNRSDAKDKGKNIVLINNAIHPGEPDGVDATMMLFRDLSKHDSLREAFKDIVLVAIPYYNIGGALNRNSTSRANQNGPEEHGFRGNAKNYDLNRDFIKMDSRNMWSFARIWKDWKPLLFIDNHVSNGADYQYTVTYLACQEDKIGPVLGAFQRDSLNPLLETIMKDRGQETVPYVNVFGRTPNEGGIQQFFDTPRYASGYGGMMGAFSYTIETHMLKPYTNRVWGTYDIMMSFLEILENHGDRMQRIQEDQKRFWKEADSIPLQWELDSSRFKTIPFKGYVAETKPSKVTGGERLFYNREKPEVFEIPFYNRYQPVLFRKKPGAYVIPQAWEDIMDRLKWNGVANWKRLSKDTLLDVTAYKIEHFETLTRPFEGHYLHYNTEVKPIQIQYKARKGDFIVPTGSEKDFFLSTVLEPEGPDSYFNWNFFDTYLQQKEGYSSYVFEDLADEILKSDSVLAKAFADEKASNPEFASNPQWQLYWIYTHTPLYEESHMRLPIFRYEPKWETESGKGLF